VSQELRAFQVFQSEHLKVRKCAKLPSLQRRMRVVLPIPVIRAISLGVLMLLQAISDGIDPRSYGRCEPAQRFLRRGQHSPSAFPAFCVCSPFRSASPTWFFGDVHYINSDVTSDHP